MQGTDNSRMPSLCVCVFFFLSHAKGGSFRGNCSQIFPQSLSRSAERFLPVEFVFRLWVDFLLAQTGLSLDSCTLPTNEFVTVPPVMPSLNRPVGNFVIQLSVRNTSAKETQIVLGRWHARTVHGKPNAGRGAAKKSRDLPRTGQSRHDRTD